MDPFKKFNEWYAAEVKQTRARIPSACCLSTVGLDGYPNARFVSLKEVTREAFVVTGPTDSRKGVEILIASKVALIFWWPETERQVRIQGDAKRISDKDADRYFKERDRDAQIVSCVSEQGSAIENLSTLHQRYDELDLKFKDKKIERPKNWGGFFITPMRVEFLEFKPSRFHERTLFQKDGKVWKKGLLQP